MTIDRDAYLDGVRTALGSRGFEVSPAEVGGRTVLAARRRDFRLRWFAVRLHTAVMVASFDAADARRQDLDAFLAAASRWAVEHRRGRGPLGLQSATAAIAVAVFPGGAGDGAAWASEPHGHHFAALAYPVAVDLQAATVIQPRRMRIGGVFTSFLRGVVRDAVEAPLTAP